MFNTHVAIAPRLKNIAYNSKEALADHLPADPVLGILQFTYRPGVDVAEPSQRAHALWQKSLEFVSTISTNKDSRKARINAICNPCARRDKLPLSALPVAPLVHGTPWGKSPNTICPNHLSTAGNPQWTGFPFALSPGTPQWERAVHSRIFVGNSGGWGGCSRIFWGKCQENEGEGEGEDSLISFSLFIALEHSEHSKHQRPEAEADADADAKVRAQLQQYIHEFKDACEDAIQDLSHRRTPGLSPFPSVPHFIDMVIFDVSLHETDQRSFGYAFSNYQATTRQTQVVGSLYSPWSAFMPRCQGWLLNDYDYKSPPQQSEQGLPLPLPVQFISIFECGKKGAREEWYRDFAERAQTQYDLLGHIVDWLRTLSTRITIQYLVVEREDPWMAADRLAKAQRPPPPPPLPPSIFDLPRARQANK